MDAVPHLPKDAKDVWLDVTPVPAAKRNQHRLMANQVMHDKCASQKFLSGHVRDVAVLVRKVDEHHCGGTRVVLIVLMRRLSTKSAFFVELVNAWAEKDLEFVGSGCPAMKRGT